MTGLESLTILAPDGSNYLAWRILTRESLVVQRLEAAIRPPPPSPTTAPDTDVRGGSRQVTTSDTSTAEEEATAADVSRQDQAKAILYIRFKLHPLLIEQTLHINTPYGLWMEMESRFYQSIQRITLRAAKEDWFRLRTMDFGSIQEYSNEMYRITSQLALCKNPVTEADMVDKTISTMSQERAIIGAMYKNMQFKSISALLGHMLVAEKMDEVAREIAASRPAGTMPTHEFNTPHQTGRKRTVQFVDQEARPTRLKKNKKNNFKSLSCSRCTIRGHLASECRTPHHLVHLYRRENDLPPSL